MLFILAHKLLFSIASFHMDPTIKIQRKSKNNAKIVATNIYILLTIIINNFYYCNCNFIFF